MSASSSCAFCRHCVRGCLSRCLIRCSSLIHLIGGYQRPRSADAGERDSARPMSSLIRLGDERRWSHWRPDPHWPDCLVRARSASCSVSSSSPERRRFETADSGTPAARCPNGIVRPSNTSRPEREGSHGEVHREVHTLISVANGRETTDCQLHKCCWTNFPLGLSIRCNNLQPTLFANSRECCESEV